ncbi:cytochrome P450 [Nocardia huaxiensis]|uniref:Cytochrome P450 n=1 Tax=Nocardia huaxiensis TaxID=2755382 RepID=A0A7D6VMI7_9NOCA|nr:cytochrome P450 [Nocardia huaxiensis]QLY33176.1 cytochrome P450 [Nocardia huaxiensis]
MSTTPTPSPGFFAQLLDPAQRADPYALFARIREQGPVRLGELPVVVLSSHRDCAAVLRHKAASVERHHASIPLGLTPVHDLAGASPGELTGTASMLFRDAPDHTRLRRLAAKAFTPSVVRALEPRITAIADAALDRAAERGELDLVEDLAYPLPVTVICELLGVPLDDEPQLRRWSMLLARALDPISATATAGSPDPGEMVRANNELHDYFEQLVRRHRTRPGNDLLSALIAAEESGDALTHDELISTCALLLIAGHETTVNLIANTALTLLSHGHRHYLSILRTAPAFATSVIEESLRYDPPVQLLPRIAREAIALPGIDIAAGDLVVLLLAAANRDPAVFADPDRFDPARGDRHLAFGLGQHFCLGAPLARLEASAALTRFARRVRDPRLDCDEPPYREHVTLRGPARLPLAFTSIDPVR